MEQAPYWIWTNPKPNNSTKVEAAARGASLKTPMAYNNDRWPSWEEQAFAEDATGAFGGGSGCIWPPRSYSCSFCGREFRSAQALGGHMNVHRRDRARLKQSSPSTSPDHLIQSQLAHQNHFMGFDEYHQYHSRPPPVCALVYHHHPNPNHQNHDPVSVVASSSSSPWPSTPSNCEIVTNNTRPPIWANFVVDGYNNNTSDPKPCKKAKVIRTDLSVSLNLVLHPTSYHHEDDEAMRSCKKRRRDSSDSSSNQEQDRAGVNKLLGDEHNTSLEDLDLELRLGGRPEPQVK